MTHCCSSDSISRNKSNTLVDARDLSHYAAWAYFLSIWKQRYSFPYGGSFDNDVEVEELIWHRWVCTLGWLGLVVVLVLGILGVLLLCFLGIAKYCVS